MPKRKFAYRPRRRFKKRRYTRRRRYAKVSRARFTSSNKWNTVLRGAEATINNSALTVTPFQFTARLVDCINFSTYTTLFDQYRINKVVVLMTPVKTQVVNRPYDDTTTAGAVLAIPRLSVVIDRDDDTLPVTFEEVYQRPNSKTTLATRKQVWAFRPTKLGMVYRSTTTTGYKVDWGRDFIDSGDSDVPHYGLKGILEAASPNEAYTYRIETKFYVSFRNRKL